MKRLPKQNGEKSTSRHQHSGEFGRLLAKSGLSQVKLAALVDVHPNSVSRWSKEGAPGAVLAFLRLYCDVQSILERN